MNNLDARSRSEGTRTALLHAIRFVGIFATFGGFIAYIFVDPETARWFLILVMLVGLAMAIPSHIAIRIHS